MRWKTYSGYKPSGVDWIDQIPAGWSMLPFKRLGDFQAGAGFPSDEQGREDEELPFYKVSDMNLPGNDIYMTSHNNAVSLETAKRLRAFVFPPDTVIFAKVGAALLLNKRRILTRPSCVDNNTMGFMRKSCNLQWIYYWMHGLDLGKLANPGAVPSVNEEQLRSIPVPVPPLREQEAIGVFLFQETSHIDQLIARKERQIELLQEKRTALISHAVTKGLNPKVKMKDSGIEWLGEVPASWLVSTVKRHYEIQLGKMLQNSPGTDNDAIVPYVKALHVLWGYVNTNDLPEMWASFSETQQYGVRKGDLLVCEGGEVGRAGIITSLPGQCIIQNALHRVRARASADARYLQYVLHAVCSSGWFDVLCNKATIAHFTREKFADLQIPIPSLIDQKSIITFLDNEIRQIDALIEKVRKSIELLREYRIALISAAVTGKIDVREEAAI